MGCSARDIGASLDSGPGLGRLAVECVDDYEAFVAAVVVVDSVDVDLSVFVVVVVVYDDYEGYDDVETDDDSEVRCRN